MSFVWLSRCSTPPRLWGCGVVLGISPISPSAVRHVRPRKKSQKNPAGFFGLLRGFFDFSLWCCLDLRQGVVHCMGLVVVVVVVTILSFLSSSGMMDLSLLCHANKG